jgi:ubiquitin thioesterase protein OTUB1
MTVGGYEAMTFEDLAEETFELLREVSGMLASQEHALAHVTQKFNEQVVSDSIVYHLRMLAASYMKGNRQEFAGFVPDGKSVDGYCSEWLERPGEEIEQIGVILLVDILLKPVNFTIEIAMLDRTEGAEVNTFRFPAGTADQQAAVLGPTIYLLYRPGHYDILYKDMILAPSMQIPQDDIAANFVAFPTANYGWVGNTMDPAGAYTTFSDTMFMIPGFAPPSTSNFGVLKTPLESPIEQTFAPSPASTWFPSAPFINTTHGSSNDDHVSALPSPPQSVQSVTLTTQAEVSHLKADPEIKTVDQSAAPARRRKKTRSVNTQTQQQPQPQVVVQTSSPPHAQTHPSYQAPPQPQADSQTLSFPAPTPSRNPPHPAMMGGGLFRVSAFSIRSWEDHRANSDPGGASPIYQNSHFNTAHFNNPNFQPEEYCPGIREDGTVARSAGLRKRSRSPATGRPLPFRKRTL